eukprot:TRINITY_DN9833_c0_g1_i1.p3 TRINITY_DN9833_c0_g1~~TRINITY_DN9833_c0_g1_i1.p3  ORF type:complete len:155 (+),score=65.44 TRINITY_DN9833_c0_g1_i1:722-1186(+)
MSGSSKSNIKKEETDSLHKVSTPNAPKAPISKTAPKTDPKLFANDGNFLERMLKLKQQQANSQPAIKKKDSTDESASAPQTDSASNKRKLTDSDDSKSDSKKQKSNPSKPADEILAQPTDAAKAAISNAYLEEMKKFQSQDCSSDTVHTRPLVK